MCGVGANERVAGTRVATSSPTAASELGGYNGSKVTRREEKKIYILILYSNNNNIKVRKEGINLLAWTGEGKRGAEENRPQNIDV